MLHSAYRDFKLKDGEGPALDGSGLPVAVTTPLGQARKGDLRLTRRSVTVAELSPSAARKATRALLSVEPELRKQIADRAHSGRT